MNPGITEPGDRVVTWLDGTHWKLRDVEAVKGDGEWRMEQQLANSYVLLAVTKGHGQLIVDRKEGRLRQDSAYVCSPGQTFGAASDSAEGLSLFLFRFDLYRETEQDEEQLRFEKERGLFWVQDEIPMVPAAQMITLCEAVSRHWQSGEETGRPRARLAFRELIYGVMKNVGLSARKDSEAAIRRTKDYMERHFNESLSIEQLARMAGVSPKYYVELFKKTYGSSAIDYLTELRMTRAKQLMAGSNVRLRDIAQQVGYSDEFYLSRKFKQEVGVSPTVYMKNRSRKVAAYSPAIIGQLVALRMLPYAAPLHPKWTAYYYETYRNDIPVHLSAYRNNMDWETNIDTLRKARPDVILSRTGLDEEEQDKLKQIAPLVQVPWAEKNWREQLQFTAEFFGASKEAELWLREYDRKVESVREQLAREAGDDTVLILRIYKDECHVFSNRSMREVLYGDLQVKPACPVGRTVLNEPITLERLAEIDADRLLLLVRQEPESLAHAKRLSGASAWQDLKAVRKHRVHCIPSDPWHEYSATAHDRIVDAALHLFSGNCPK
ncbi:ABC transporter substrate-binding protein [Paenibacillus elgii]|uniref:ABC transporter substrate-binding protein n=1 Tax=Paenibacillus elgii TaxID=189691 RepID=UPI000248C262|nr:AraC family transcriptional regulator [Paenibacillus elgii]